MVIQILGLNMILVSELRSKVEIYPYPKF